MGVDGAARTVPMPALRISLLGEVQAEHETGPVEVGPPQRRAVLAALLLTQGRPMTTDQLVEAVWGEDRGAKSDAAVRAHVSVLRRVLEPDRPPRAPSTVIRSVPSGYLLLPRAVSLDVQRFRTLVGEADEHRRRARPRQALQTLGSALDLWRGGQALVGVPGPNAEVARAVLEDERLAAWEEYLETELGLREPERPVHSGLLRALAAHPHRERLHGLLIRSYQRQGRRAEALAAYAAARERLREDLGVEPGPALRELHRKLLADEPLEATPPAEPEPAAPPARVPPPPPAAAPISVAPSPAAPSPAAPSPAAPSRPLTPVPGSSFRRLTPVPPPPDTRTTDPVPSAPAGRGPAFSSATAPLVGVEAEPAPTAVDVRRAGPLPRAAPLLGREETVAAVAGALRDALAGRHGATVLVRGLPGVGTSAVALAAAHAVAAAFPGGAVVLGRAADEDAWARAVAGLDPSQPCLLLADGLREPGDAVRAQRACDALRGRGAADVVLLCVGTHRLPRVRARRIEVVPLGEADSTALFAQELGDGRATEETAAVGIIVALHSGFPQLVVSTAGMLASRPSWSLMDWVNDLMSGAGSWGSLQRHGLGLFFTPHYDALDVAEAALFRVAGLHPFAPMAAAAAARLLDVGTDRATFLLESLHDRGLVESPRPAEYLVPFLLWNYARIVALADDPAPVRDGQVDRMLTYYREQAEELVAATGAADEPPGTREQARARLDALRGCLEALRHEHADRAEAGRLSAALDRADGEADGGVGEVPQA